MTFTDLFVESSSVETVPGDGEGRRRGVGMSSGTNEKKKNGRIKSKSKIAHSHALLKNAGLGLCGLFTVIKNRAYEWMCC